LQNTAVLVPASDRELQANPQANPRKNRKMKYIEANEEGTPVGNNR